MLKSMIKTVLLVLAITLIAYGVKEFSTVYILIGGICAGAYNGIKDWDYEK